MQKRRDLLDDLFIAQGQKPDSLEPVDLAALAPAQRALLVADGTVTQLVEALALERLELAVLAQEEHRLAAADPWLAMGAEAAVWRRRVVLSGARSGLPYIFAGSTIAVDRIPAGVARAIEQGRESIGRLLRGGIECRRELLWCGVEYPDQLPDSVRGWREEGALSRTYRIASGGSPLMLIEEKFPLRWPG